MASIKSYVPALARIVQMSPAALYERHRALVRGGHLGNQGQGPGRGVRATPESIALLLLSIMSTDRLHESEARVQNLAQSRVIGFEGICPFTKQKSFLPALTDILESTRALSVAEIIISRTADIAQVKWWERRSEDVTTVEFRGRRRQEATIAVSATLNHEALLKIAEDVQAMELDQFYGDKGDEK